MNFYRVMPERSWQTIMTAASFMVLIGMSLAGCATTSLTAGASLAKVGQTAAIQMEQNTTLSGNSILALRKAVAFNDGFNGAVGNHDSQVFLSNIVAIQGKLARYGIVLEKLSSSYSALGDLAGYNAVGNFNTSIDSLATATTNFAGAIGKPVDIPSVDTSGVKAIGGFVLGSVQADNVKNASQQIEVVLKQIITVLDDPNTKGKLIPVQAEVAGQINQAAAILFTHKVYSYASLLDELGAPLSLKSTSASDTIVVKPDNVKILAGLNNVAVELAQEQTYSQEASYDKSLEALKALLPLHESLQKGAPLNLDSIINITSQLQSIAASLQPAKGK